jgi:hypothetical protein
MTRQKSSRPPQKLQIRDRAGPRESIPVNEVSRLKRLTELFATLPAAASIREFRKHLRQLEREVGYSMASETACCGVTLAQCHHLLEVDARGSTSITELATALELDKSTLSRTVDGACRAGLLSREIEPR